MSYNLPPETATFLAQPTIITACLNICAAAKQLHKQKMPVGELRLKQLAKALLTQGGVSTTDAWTIRRTKLVVELLVAQPDIILNAAQKAQELTGVQITPEAFVAYIRNLLERHDLSERRARTEQREAAISASPELSLKQEQRRKASNAASAKAKARKRAEARETAEYYKELAAQPLPQLTDEHGNVLQVGRMFTT